MYVSERRRSECCRQYVGDFSKHPGNDVINIRIIWHMYICVGAK